MAHAMPGDLPKTVQQNRDAQTRAAVLEALAKLGGNLVQEDALIFKGTEFVLPEQYNGNTQAAIDYLKQHIAQQEKEHEIRRIFKYRPNDVAYAVQAVLKQMFGTTGLGQSWTDMFGQEHPPVFKTINIGLDQTVQVPQDLISFPPIEGTLNVGAQRSSELGILGAVSVTCPRKYRGHVEGLFTAIEDYLANSSIYRGKAIDGATDPNFLDTSKVDPDNVVYSDRVLEELRVHVWAPIVHTDLLRQMKQPIKRAALLHGPYGTGKSLAGYLTAQKAQEHGWTFIFVRPKDNLDQAMQTAQLYAPAVVFFEDIDVVAEEGTPAKISQLLDSFDGITGKGKEIVAVLTTNHVDKIHKGMLRPGRMDAVIEIGELDAHGVEKLIKQKIPADKLAKGLDYNLVASAMKGFMPAFTSEAVNRAFRYALVRTDSAESVLTTDDFINAALGLRPHFDLMSDAHEGKGKPELDLAFREVVKEVVQSVGFYDEDDDRGSTYAARYMKVEDEQQVPRI